MEGELSTEHVLTEITELKDLNDECDNGFQIRNTIYIYTKAMYTVIHRCGDKAFDDMSEESGKNNILSALSLIYCCGLFQFKASLSRSKKMVN